MRVVTLQYMSLIRHAADVLLDETSSAAHSTMLFTEAAKRPKTDTNQAHGAVSYPTNLLGAAQCVHPRLSRSNSRHISMQAAFWIPSLRCAATVGCASAAVQPLRPAHGCVPRACMWHVM